MEWAADRGVSRVLRRTLDDWYRFELRELAPRIAPGGSLEPPFPFVVHPRTSVHGMYAGRPISLSAGALHVPAPDQVVDVAEFAFTAIMFVVSRGIAGIRSTPDVRRGVVTWAMTDLHLAGGLPDFSLHPRRSGSRQWMDDLLLPVEEFESIGLTERFEFVVPLGSDQLEIWTLVDPETIERLEALPEVHVRTLGDRLFVAIPGGAIDADDIHLLMDVIVDLAEWLESAAGSHPTVGGWGRCP